MQEIQYKRFQISITFMFPDLTPLNDDFMNIIQLTLPVLSTYKRFASKWFEETLV